jgi:hypothetical protein
VVGMPPLGPSSFWSGFSAIIITATAACTPAKTMPFKTQKKKFHQTNV